MPLETFVVTSPQGEVLPPGMQDLLHGIALAVQKRAIYPAGHPLLAGAAESVHERLKALLSSRMELSIGVGFPHLIVDGVSTDRHDQRIGELARRLRDHLVGGVRISQGVSLAEVEDFITCLAVSAPECGDTMGARPQVFNHAATRLRLFPTAFDQLALLDAEGRAVQRQVPALEGTADVQAALALLSVSSETEGDTGEAVVETPEAVARALAARVQTREGREAVIRVLQEASGSLDQNRNGSEFPRRYLTELFEQLSDDALTVLMAFDGNPQAREILLQQATHVLGPIALVNLARAAAASADMPIPGSVLTLLNKLARAARGGHSCSRNSDLVLRGVVTSLLGNRSTGRSNGASEGVPSGLPPADTHATLNLYQYNCEPERILEVSLEIGVVAPGTEMAVERLVADHGMAATLARILDYPPSTARDTLETQLLSETTLREQLAATNPDLRMLDLAVTRLGSRALDPLLEVLGHRGDEETAWIVDLLAAIGDAAVDGLGNALATLPPQAIRHAINVFDRLGRWPDGLDPKIIANHQNVRVRLEAILSLLRHDTTRLLGVRLGLMDPDARVFSAALKAVMNQCSLDGARILMRRFDEPTIPEELRVRMARAIGTVRNAEVLEWLLSRALTMHWLTGTKHLRGPDELLAVIVATLARHHAEDSRAGEVLGLALRSRKEAVRRAAAHTRDATEAEPA